MALSCFPAKQTSLQRSRENLETQKAVEALGRKAIIYTADLASQEEVAGITSTILKDGYQINILINCAGIQRRHPSHQFPDNDWNEVRNLFQLGVFIPRQPF